MSSQPGSGSPHIEAVIFDYGQVLSRRPTREEFARMARVLNLDFDPFHALWEATRGPYDRGDQSPQEYWQSIAARASAKLTHEQIDLLRNLEIKMWCQPDPEMLTWLSRLQAAGLKTALLSNITSDLVTHLRANYSWLNKFTFATFSVDVRLIKPDPAIYEHTLRGLGVPAQEALFLDDRLPNVQAARALGIHAIQFHSLSQLVQDLAAMNFPILPDARSSSEAAISSTSANLPGA
jgi:putative hydrolase of the HAD superfamily